jgi:hypothetical protein
MVGGRGQQESMIRGHLRHVWKGHNEAHFKDLQERLKSGMGREWQRWIWSKYSLCTCDAPVASLVLDWFVGKQLTRSDCGALCAPKPQLELGLQRLWLGKVEVPREHQSRSTCKGPVEVTWRAPRALQVDCQSAPQRCGQLEWALAGPFQFHKHSQSTSCVLERTSVWDTRMWDRVPSSPGLRIAMETQAGKLRWCGHPQWHVWSAGGRCRLDLPDPCSTPVSHLLCNGRCLDVSHNEIDGCLLVSHCLIVPLPGLRG